MFELLARRFTKLVEKQSDDVAIYEDLLALILEIINSTLTHRLKHNSQLVYALLQKREIFAPFQLHQRLSDLVQNMDHVIHFFNARVSEANLKAPSSNEVLRLIEQASRTWSNTKLVVRFFFALTKIIIANTFFFYSLYLILNSNMKRNAIRMNFLYPIFGLSSIVELLFTGAKKKVMFLIIIV